MGLYGPEEVQTLLSVKVPEDWHRELRHRADEAGTNVSQVARRALSLYLFGELRYPEVPLVVDETAMVDPLLSEPALATPPGSVLAESELANPDIREV